MFEVFDAAGRMLGAKEERAAGSVELTFAKGMRLEGVAAGDLVWRSSDPTLVRRLAGSADRNDWFVRVVLLGGLVVLRLSFAWNRSSFRAGIRFNSAVKSGVRRNERDSPSLVVQDRFQYQ